MPESHDLTRGECDKLLRSGVVGRIAFTAPHGLHIVPVNYSVVDDQIIIRTSPASVVGTHGPGAELAFEVDHVDYEYWTAWSVVARGHGEVISDEDEVQRIHRTWAPHPWASGQRDLYLALRWTELTGRRLGPARDARQDRPVNRSRLP